MKILIVEQNESFRLKLKTILQSFDSMHQIDFASSGYDSAVIARSCQYDIIISEVFLPDLRGDIAITMLDYDPIRIGMTAGIASADIRRSFDYFFLKPIDMELLRITLLNSQNVVSASSMI